MLYRSCQGDGGGGGHTENSPHVRYRYEDMKTRDVITSD
jgi:hypothetical protein